MTSSAPDRSRPPAAKAIRPFHFPDFSIDQLSNGLRVLHARLPRFPLAVTEFVSPAGARFEEQPGLATVHAGLLDEGTKHLSALEIAAQTEQLGGYLSSGANWDTGFVSTTCLANRLPDGLRLIAEICRAPEFPEEEIHRARQQRLAEILRRQNQPNPLADLFFSRAVYRETVYAHPLIGTAESVENLERQDFFDFYRRCFGVKGSALVAVGDFVPDQLLAWAEEAFGDWQLSEAPTPPQINPQPLAQTQVYVVDRPGSTQTRLQLGHLGLPRNHPDFEKVLILNGIFGGKFTSRINLNLREQHAYTYGAHSRVVRRRDAGPFVISTSVKTEVAGNAVAQLLFELRRIREDLVSTEELRETCDYLIGAFPYTLQTIDDLAQRLEDLVIFDLPPDLYQGYPASLVNITREDVLQAAQRYFQPDHLAIVAVGPAETLQSQLAPHGPVTVITP